MAIPSLVNRLRVAVTNNKVIVGKECVSLMNALQIPGEQIDRSHLHEISSQEDSDDPLVRRSFLVPWAGMVGPNCEEMMNGM